MSAKVPSTLFTSPTFFTVGSLLGLAGGTISCVCASIVGFAERVPVISVLALVIAASMVVFASRVYFPKNGEIESESVSDIHIVGGPIQYVCFLKKKGKWRWFISTEILEVYPNETPPSIITKEPNQTAQTTPGLRPSVSDL